MFSSCTVPPDNKQTKLESWKQEPFASAGKNTGIDLVPCCTRSVFLSYLQRYGYSRSPWVSFVTTLVLCEDHKNYFKDEYLILSEANSQILVHFLTNRNGYFINIMQTR